MKMDFKNFVRCSILDASRILQEKSGEIAADVEQEKVTEINIRIDIDLESCPSLEISKQYRLNCCQ